jgi:pilus assembly protein CpaB
MNRRNRTLIVLGVAVLLASSASYIVYRAISKMPVREVEVATMYVAVAAENLPTGTRILKEHVKMVGWPKSTPLQGAFSSPDAVIGRGLIQPIGINEPLTETKLAPIEAGAGLPPLITPGMRALSIRVNDVIGVAGFTVAGTRVDVLVTLRDGENSTTRVVVSNLQVLSAGRSYDVEKAREGNAQAYSVVTVLVTPEDAERITLAQSTGSLMLALRNPLDVTPTDTKGARMANLLGAPAPPPVIKEFKGQRRAMTPKPAAPVVPAIYEVQTLRAGKKGVEAVATSGPGGEAKPAGGEKPAGGGEGVIKEDK